LRPQAILDEIMGCDDGGDELDVELMAILGDTDFGRSSWRIWG